MNDMKFFIEQRKYALIRLTEIYRYTTNIISNYSDKEKALKSKEELGGKFLESYDNIMLSSESKELKSELNWFLNEAGRY